MPMTTISKSWRLRRIDHCITQLKAQGPSRTCNESIEEEEKKDTSTIPMTTIAKSKRCVRLIDSCITQLKAQRPSRTCNGSI